MKHSLFESDTDIDPHEQDVDYSLYLKKTDGPINRALVACFTCDCYDLIFILY